MIKVAYITDATGLGGGETSLLNHLIVCRETSGLHPILICPQGSLEHRARALGITTRVLVLESFGCTSLTGLWKFLRSVERLIRIARLESVSYLHTESAKACCLAVVASKILSIPLFHTYHGYWDVRRSIVNFVVRRAIKRTFVVSRHLLPEAKRVFGSEKTQWLPLGLNKAFITPCTQSANGIRLQFGLPDKAKIILQLARYQRVKGQGRLLSAFEIGKQRGQFKDAILVFVGDVIDGSDHTSHEYYNEVYNRAKSSQWSSQIYFLPFQCDPQIVLSLADVVVVPSDYESFGMVVVEAMAMRKPVVATGYGGPAEIIRDGLDGLLFNPDDIQALIGCIAKVLEDVNFRSGLASEAYRKAWELYAPTARANELLKHYCEAI